ncbi:MAG: GIY-YIG nuclease family protein [Ruminococcus sp.]|nr:GIY-YIG nuclease family protein [Ruminococcus sp.]
MYYTYMLLCNDNSIYTGITTDLSRRFYEHLNSQKGAKYTRTHTPLKILAAWKSSNRSTASKLEYRIKKLTKTAKEQIIYNNDFSVFDSKIDKSEYQRLYNFFSSSL